MDDKLLILEYILDKLTNASDILSDDIDVMLDNTPKQVNNNNSPNTPIAIME